ncbi:hypothetical protein L6452_22704 [Arctium lappa]|uniref:Uncharacterized protein n=1 Tax=Arctium lappa TaxID=4217 RepID=A0ACB9B1C1_ARCLA|nr:hypothetical protein L6452_22704 [Arctium lappa]
MAITFCIEEACELKTKVRMQKVRLGKGERVSVNLEGRKVSGVTGGRGVASSGFWGFGVETQLFILGKLVKIFEDAVIIMSGGSAFHNLVFHIQKTKSVVCSSHLSHIYKTVIQLSFSSFNHRLLQPIFF